MYAHRLSNSCNTGCRNHLQWSFYSLQLLLFAIIEFFYAYAVCSHLPTSLWSQQTARWLERVNAAGSRFSRPSTTCPGASKILQTVACWCCIWRSGMQEKLPNSYVSPLCSNMTKFSIFNYFIYTNIFTIPT